MRLRSFVAVAVAEAGSCNSDWSPSLETSICYSCVPKKQKKKRKKKRKLEVGRDHLSLYRSVLASQDI